MNDFFSSVFLKPRKKVTLVCNAVNEGIRKFLRLLIKTNKQKKAKFSYSKQTEKYPTAAKDLIPTNTNEVSFILKCMFCKLKILLIVNLHLVYLLKNEKYSSEKGSMI